MLEMTLLIADDEEELLENMEYDLKKIVKKIITASDGAQALLKLQQHKIDCVISDINMPNKNGLQFVQIIEKGLFKNGVWIAENEVAIDRKHWEITH